MSSLRHLTQTSNGMSFMNRSTIRGFPLTAGRLVLLAGLMLVGAGRLAWAQNVVQSVSVPAERTALLIGAWRYTDPTFPSLPEQGILKDLAGMVVELQSLGFQVAVVLNPDLGATKRAVDEFVTRLEARKGTGLFYFSGHGAEYQGLNFLVPVGTNVSRNSDLESEGLNMLRVLRGMEGSGTEVNLVFLDCCRNALDKGAGNSGLATMKSKGALIGFATRSGDVAAADVNGSPYTQALVKHLGIPGISLTDMHTLVTGALGDSQRPGQYSDLGRIYQLVPNQGDPSKLTDEERRQQFEVVMSKLAEKSKSAVARPVKLEPGGGKDGEGKKVVETPPGKPMVPEPKPTQTPTTTTAAAAAPEITLDYQGKGGEAVDVPLGNGVKVRFRYCPPGEFVMGSPASEAGRVAGIEGPVRVTLSQGFWLAEREWARDQDRERHPLIHQIALPPVEILSWREAKILVDSLNQQVALDGWMFALPTEAQWEYACRAGTTTPFHFGTKLNGTQANMNGGAPYGTLTTGPERGEFLAAGQFQANPWNLQDMHGNAYEWCLDYWDGVSPLRGGVDPDQSVGSGHVVRGGNFRSPGKDCRAASRLFIDPGNPNSWGVACRLALVRKKS